MEIIYVIYFLTAAVVAIGAYAAMRAIDYGFNKRETRNEYGYTQLRDEYRYKMAKGCIQSYTDGQKRMAMDLTKSLNDNLYEMYKKMGDL